MLAAATLLSGCAHVHVDAQGRTHVKGLVWMTLPAPDPQRSAAGQALRVRSLGMALTRSDVASSLVLGWHDSTLAFLYNDSLVPARWLRAPGTLAQEPADAVPP
jgi:hypothetical protein